MENATKALLIGASILIAILLISVGMRVFNSGANASKSTGKVMEATEITTFNSQFSVYDGKEVSASKANDIIQKINASNAVNSKTVGTNLSTATAGKTYEVEVTTSDSGTNKGYVSYVKFTEI